MSDYINKADFDLKLEWYEEIDSTEAKEEFLRFGMFSSDFDIEMVEEEEADSNVNIDLQEKSNPKECISLSNDDVLTFIENEENKNTMKKTLLDIQQFERFLKTKNEQRQFHTISPEDLDPYIANFILSAKKTNGSEYEPSTLRNIISSLDRKLKRMRYPYSIMTEKGPAFQLSRDAMKAKQKSLKKMGKGNKEKADRALTDEEIEILYSKNLLGANNPTVLLNTVWLNNTMHFGMRGTKENYNLRWGDIRLQKTSSGLEYLELQERQTKTRTGENVMDSRKVTPKMYTNTENPNRDPIKLYKAYALKRPHGYSNPDDPFYIAPRTVPLKHLDEQWFVKLPVGEKKLGGLMKSMAESGNLDSGKRLTNHSVIKTLVQKLRNARVPPTSIMQISGHKNMQSVLNYSEMGEHEQRHCSNVLSSTNENHDNFPKAITPPSAESRIVPIDHRTLATSSTASATQSDLTNSQVSTAQNQTFSNQNILQSLFAGATLNIQTMHVHMK